MVRGFFVPRGKGNANLYAGELAGTQSEIVESFGTFIFFAYLCSEES
jgi:hypothetical protein